MYMQIKTLSGILHKAILKFKTTLSWFKRTKNRLVKTECMTHSSKNHARGSVVTWGTSWPPEPQKKTGRTGALLLQYWDKKGTRVMSFYYHLHQYYYCNYKTFTLVTVWRSGYTCIYQPCQLIPVVAASRPPSLMGPAFTTLGALAA